MTARSVLGANELDKAFSTDGKTGFLDVASGINPLNIASGIMAFADLAASLKTGNPLTTPERFRLAHQRVDGHHRRQPGRFD